MLDHFQPMTFRQAEFSHETLQSPCLLAHTRTSAADLAEVSDPGGSYAAGKPSSVSNPSLSSCGVLRHKVHDGSWRWHVSAHHACPSRVLQYHRLGLPVLGFSYAPCPDQYPPTGGSHLAALQRLTVSWLPEEQRQLLRCWGCPAGTFICDTSLFLVVCRYSELLTC